METHRLRVWSVRALSAFYLIAGINHFVMPEFYLGLIPPYLPFHGGINVLSGAVEIALALSLIEPKLRYKSGWGIVLMLVAFIPAHVYFIQIGSCVDGGLCVAPWIGWARLLVVHPFLIFWAYWSVLWTSKTT